MGREVSYRNGSWIGPQYMIFVGTGAKNGTGAYGWMAAEVGKAEKDVLGFELF